MSLLKLRVTVNKLEVIIPGVFIQQASLILSYLPVQVDVYGSPRLYIAHVSCCDWYVVTVNELETTWALCTIVG